MEFEKILQIIKTKTDKMMEVILPDEIMIEVGNATEGSYTEKRIDFFEPGNWTHSFLNGIIAYLYCYYKEEKYLDYLLKQENKYYDLLYNNEKEIGHDVGFLYSLYAVPLYKITGDVKFKKLALKAADELGKRYQFKANVMQSFFDMRKRGITDEFAMIIADDMMNMHLLMWAYKETGHSFYRSVYENHIENSIKNLIRDDYSVCHAYNFDAKTGKPLTEVNYCGYTIGSHWARGTTWMIYGLTSAILQTENNERYLWPLIGVLEKYLSCIEGNPIPVWDFRIPSGEPHILDTSAAAISASAFMESSKLNLPKHLKEKCRKVAEETLNELCSNYMADDQSENIITCGQSGDMETGVLWGDYFFVELLMKTINGKDCINFWL